jgi:hypothetical protein
VVRFQEKQNMGGGVNNKNDNKRITCAAPKRTAYGAVPPQLAIHQEIVIFITSSYISFLYLIVIIF